MAETIGQALTSRKIIFASIGILTLSLGGLWLLDPDAFPTGSVTVAEPPSPALAPESGSPPPTDAERIAQLQRSIEEQRKYLEKLKTQLNDPSSEYNKADKSFRLVDTERDSARREVEVLKAAGKNAAAGTRQAALKDIEARWQRQRQRFNLAIQAHKVLQESIAVATKQLHDEENALARRTGASSTPAAPTPEAAQAPSAPAAAETQKSPSSLPTPVSLLSTPSSLQPASSASPKAAVVQEDKKLSREVERVREESKLKEEAAKKAELKAQSYNKRIETVKQNIALTTKLVEDARRRADYQLQKKAQLEKELEQKTSAKAPNTELQDAARSIETAQQRFEEISAEIRSTSSRLHELQEELSYLQGAQVRSQREADEDKKAADAAEEKIAQLQNPFRPRNIVHWLLSHGPRLLLIALGTFFFHRLCRAFSRRLVQIMSQGATKRGTLQDRENRAETLAGVFNSALSLLILGGGSLMLLDEVGIPIVPLMGGAAVVGLAVAFGAQNLIKDYFSGFMVLLEDQYGINDVVKIGEVSGLVEHISLRTTVLRDLEGIVHFIPHGTITTVSNLTHGWSRALFNVSIDYKENVDRVMEVLLELGHEMRRDPVFGSLVLADPEMLGVDEFCDSSVIIKFFLKTRPLQQWTVKREMLRRIKKRFDDLGIVIPYPHQTVHHQYDAPPPPSLPYSRSA